MPPLKKVTFLTDEEKYKAQLQADRELIRLKRQYVLLERDRYQYSPSLKLLKLNHVLGITKKEYANILQDLALADNQSQRRKNAKVNESLASLLNQYDLCHRKVEEEKRYIVEVDDNIRILEKDVKALSSQDLNDKDYEQRVLVAVKTVEALDNKLEVQMKKFGSVCMELKSMRMEIEGLLWEREGFIKIWNKMIDKLAVGKRFMMDLIEQATLAFDRREEWCNKLQSLRIKARRDFVSHCHNMNELIAEQENNKKVEEFFRIKGRKRVMKDLLHKETVKRMEQQKQLKEMIDKFTGMLNEILEFTKEPQVKVIAKKYYNRESDNFMLFSHTTELIREIEKLNDKLGHLNIEIENQIAIRDMRFKQQNNNLEKLSKELQQAQKDYEVSEEEVKTNDEYIEKMLEGIGSLFKLCKCNNDPLLELLDDNKTINQFNVMLYFELLEKKVLHVLLEVYYRQKNLYGKKVPVGERIVSDEKPKHVIYSLEQIAGRSPCPLCFEKEMVNDVIDTVQFVLSRNEAIRRVKNRLSSQDDSSIVHNVSNCHLPKSRGIMQARYQ